MAKLANSYSDLGRRQEAMELRETVSEASQTALGSEHADTLMVMTNVSTIFFRNEAPLTKSLEIGDRRRDI